MRVSPILLGLFVSLSIVALVTVTPVQAAKRASAVNSSGGTSYSCNVGVTYTPSWFTVQTTITATGGSLPGRTETDYVDAYKDGVLYMTQSATYSVERNTATFTVYVPVPSNGVGAYTFQSTIFTSMGSQLATCTGTYAL